ncbi:MAG: futalosine hydrolase [Trueperaceae bacterium]
MDDARPLRLVVGATRREVEPLLERLDGPSLKPLPYGEAHAGHVCGVPAVVAWLGVGKANTAAGLALAIDLLRPGAVVQLGVGGAFDGWGLDPGSAAVAAEEVHLDLGADTANGFEDLESLGFPLLTTPQRIFNRVPVDSEFAAVLGGGRWPALPFGTAETVTGIAQETVPATGRFRVAVESMEGAAAAQVCLALGVPFGEVRGVSNRVGERDLRRWRIGGALEAATEVLGSWFELGAPVKAANSRSSTPAR